LAVTLEGCRPAVPKKTALAWAQFTATVSQLEQPAVRNHPAAAIRLVLEAGYEDHLKAQYTNYRARREDLEQLGVFARQFASTEEFLSQLALLTNLEVDDERPAASDSEQIRLSTVHQAKGLEFDVVFVIMLCDGLFPSSRSLSTPEGEEEERRLFYVAITRARQELYLSHPLLRRSTVREEEKLERPSRFLEEVPLDLLEEWNLHGLA